MDLSFWLSLLCESIFYLKTEVSKHKLNDEFFHNRFMSFVMV